MKTYIDRAVDFFLVLLMVAMAVVVFLQVFYRYVLDAPLSWPEEIARLLVVWLTFVGGYMAMREHRHVGFDLLVKKVSPRVQAVIRILGRAMVVVFLLVVVGQGWIFMRKFIGVEMPYTGLSIGIFAYSVFPISGALMILQAVVDFADSVRVLRSPTRAE